jgi:hypothetical protein
MAQGTHGAGTDYSFNKVTVFNADDLSDTDFACYFTPKLDIVNMTTTYDATLKALHISVIGDSLKFF